MWFNKLNKELEDQIDNNIRDIKALERENANLKERLKEYQARFDAEFAKASFGIDWTAMNAFSIERNREHGIEKTIIGYMLAEPVVTTENDTTYKDVVREWTLYCSHEEHQRLVAEFNEWKADKYGY